jgi:phosphoesterase, MJ0936 family
MTIGLLSDTHSDLDPKVLEYFADVDEIWHAGDIGDPHLLETLQKTKPLRAVFGNIDEQNLQHALPEDLWFELEGLTFWMTHIGGAPPNYNPRVKKILKDRVPDVFICGHSHILRVKKDPAFSNMLYINPGAAGNHGFHAMKTIIRFEVTNKAIQKMEVIELGKRGQIIQ